MKQCARSGVAVALLLCGLAAAEGRAQVEDRPLRPCTIQEHPVGRGLHQANLWPGGIVHYEFDENVGPAERQATLEMLALLESACAVQFFERTDPSDPAQANYIHVQDSTQNSSAIGMIGGRQSLNMHNWNAPLIIAHEFMHALGIRHEHQRADRDTYIIIHEENVEGGQLHNFILNDWATMVGPYDFDSLMHYGTHGFSSNGQPTIEVRPPYDQHADIGQRDHLSGGDIMTLQLLYGDLGPPANDDCAGALPIRPGERVHASLLASTASAATPTCGASAGNRDLWYRFDVPVNGIVTFHTCGSNDSPALDLGMDTALSVWADCGDGAVEVACNDDSDGCADAGAARDSSITLPVQAGEQLFIRVSHNGDAFGNGGFVLAADFEMVNDDCAMAVPVYAGLTLHGSIGQATNDGGARCGFSTGQPDVWFEFTAPADGRLLVNTCGTHDLPGLDQGMFSELSLHSACSPTGDFELACNYFESPQVQCAGIDNGRAVDAAIDHPVAAGERILIRVSNSNGRMLDGSFVLNVDFAPADCLCERDGDIAQVDVFDLLAYLDSWFAGEPDADLDGRAGVDVFDLLVYLDCWFSASGGELCM